MSQKTFNEGYEARGRNAARSQNPYCMGSVPPAQAAKNKEKGGPAADWWEGWDFADLEISEARGLAAMQGDY